MKVTRAPKITAKIATADGLMEVEGRTSGVPGLIVTRYTSYNRDTNRHGVAPGPPRWIVTHEPSGYAVRTGPFDQVTDALECCRLLQGVFDWTTPRDEIPFSDLDIAVGVKRAFQQAENRRLARELAKLRSAL